MAMCAQCNINGVLFVVAAVEGIVTTSLLQVKLEKCLVFGWGAWFIAILSPIDGGALPNPNSTGVGLLFDEAVH